MILLVSTVLIVISARWVPIQIHGICHFLLCFASPSVTVLQNMNKGSLVHLPVMCPFSPHLRRSFELWHLPLHCSAICRNYRHFTGVLWSLILQITQPNFNIPLTSSYYASLVCRLITTVCFYHYAFFLAAFFHIVKHGLCACIYSLPALRLSNLRLWWGYQYFFYAFCFFGNAMPLSERHFLYASLLLSMGPLIA